MYILGINPGHNGTAALLKDGKIISCMSEERFSRIKNHFGFPFKAINYCLSDAKITPKDLDHVVLGILIGDSIYKQGHTDENFMNNYTGKKGLFSRMAYRHPSLVSPLIGLKHIQYTFQRVNRKRDTIREISKHYGIDKKKIYYIEHHKAHALAPCFNLEEKTLVFTLDAEGDDLCATVNIFDKGNLRRISETPKSASLGYLYAIVTIYLGMKANQHEFKVMGLAPYAKKDKVDKVCNELKKIIWVDGLKFKSKFRMQYFDEYIKDKMKFVRFDVMAGAVQKLTEELTYQWVKNAITKTGISKIALSGGVFMNVKACQMISELPEVTDIFVMPSSGDECTAIGACYHGLKHFQNIIPHPLENLYLGPEPAEVIVASGYKAKKCKNINQEIAKLLAKGEIVARCSGRSEWGARALGNRSILANPNHKDTIRILNQTIKDRDFWMPFTPSILNEDEFKYIENSKLISSPYMNITFNSTEYARKNIPAAMHPYDFTIRPQIVQRDWNPEYWELINEFKKLTGIGAVLNTSFNLHGEPNVLTPEDAFHTLDNSSLKYLAIGDYLFTKMPQNLGDLK